MSNDQNESGELTEFAELIAPEIPGLSGSVDQAVANGIAAVDPMPVGDHGLLLTIPDGYKTELLDVRNAEDIPRRVSHCQNLVGIDSLGRYVAAHQSADTRAYLRDVYGSGRQMLVSDTPACTVVIDDHHADNVPDARAHSAVLVLRPTSAARRWGGVLDVKITQEQFLELVVDGAAEIASPDAALLRDLVSDLHAIRTAEVSTVVRTGGQGSIQLAENVKLSAGTGDKVDFPEVITIVLSPFAGIGDVITLTVKVHPVATSENRVVFTLKAPGLDDQLAHVMSEIGTEIYNRTSLNPLWTP